MIQTRGRKQHHLLTLALAALLLTLLAGCQRNSPKGKPFDLTGEGTPEAAWPFWPRSMRIHPLSRITDNPKDEDQILVETRIEFSDGWSDPCKALGMISLDLLDGGDPNRYDPTKDHFEVNLRDLAINEERWDQVTRTYVLKLEVSRFRIPIQPQLVAVFESADGTRAEDRANIRPYQK